MRLSILATIICSLNLSIHLINGRLSIDVEHAEETAYTYEGLESNDILEDSLRLLRSNIDEAAATASAKEEKLALKNKGYLSEAEKKKFVEAQKGFAILKKGSDKVAHDLRDLRIGILEQNIPSGGPILHKIASIDREIESVNKKIETIKHSLEVSNQDRSSGWFKRKIIGCFNFS
ncbi:hypothetical protein BY996DRAFT_8308980 [Phakopsora pachyrhizi]|nr:hypothetical protein BY996DRAFT_8308980 [Phakopsora pachyrhizi]